MSKEFQNTQTMPSTAESGKVKTKDTQNRTLEVITKSQLDQHKGSRNSGLNFR
jgi:hypothetical protein